MTETQEQSFDDIFGPFLQKSELSKKYDTASTLDDLFLTAAERVCLSAASIMLSLKGPKRGRLVLKALKIFKHQAYDAYWNRNNKLFVQCLIFIMDKLKTFCYGKGIVISEEHFDQLATWAGVYYCNLLNMSSDEKEIFKKEIIHLLISYHDRPPKDQNELLYSIIGAHGKKPNSKGLAQLLKATLITDPLMMVEPWEFILNYNRLVK